MIWRCFEAQKWGGGDFFFSFQNSAEFNKLKVFGEVLGKWVCEELNFGSSEVVDLFGEK